MGKNKIIEVGQFVEIMNVEDEGSKKHKTRVESVISDSEWGIVIPIVGGNPLSIHTGARFELSFSSEASLYIQMAEAVKRYMSGPVACVEFRKVGQMKRINRRQYFRMSVLLDGSVKRVDAEAVTMTTTNLSAGGVRFVCTDVFESGEKVEVGLVLKDKTLTLSGQVISCELVRDSIRRYDTRVKFFDVSRTYEQIILQYLFEQQRNIKRKGLA